MKKIKIKRGVITAVLIFACYLLQCTVFSSLELAGIKPNLMIILTSSIGFMRGSKEGMLVGFFSGLLDVYKRQVQGSSIELSADGPIKPPYAVYFQGGLTWYHAKLGILKSVQAMLDAGVLEEDRVV